MKPVSLFFLLLFTGTFTLAQTPKPKHTQPPILAKRIKGEIKIDGKLTESDWFGGTPAKDFWTQFPNDSTLCPVQTEVYMAYDDQTLYIGAKCYIIGQDFVITSLRRDFRAGGNDNITFVFDSFNDRTNAFVFGMNPLGVNREALISNGGRTSLDFNENWDNKWIGESFVADTFWSCELAIPFSSLRFRKGSQDWNFNCYRFDTQTNTRSTWNHIPQNQIIMSLAYMSNIHWEEPLNTTGSSVSLIPYLTSGWSKDFLANTPGKSNFTGGADAKVALTPALNLDLTVNPDFSQVEVDRQVINLDRFEIFFPERRQFFLENADLFSSFGNARINPFFSRRIGIGRDSSGLIVQTPIAYGARLSGKLDNNWRLGVLNMQSMQGARDGIPNANFSVLAVQRKLFARSNIGAILVNKQSFSQDKSIEIASPYNRVAGLDYNLASSDNKWLGKAFFHQAITSDNSFKAGQKFAHGAFLTYIDRAYSFTWDQQWVRAGYNPEVGFTPRRDYFRIAPAAQLFFYPQNTWLNQHSLGLETEVFWKPEYGKTDHTISLFWDSDLKNTAMLRGSLNHNYIYLFEPFDPSRSGGKALDKDTEYNFLTLEGSFVSDQRRRLNFRLEPTLGKYFNGWLASFTGGLTYRYQPYGSIEMTFNYSHIALPRPYATANLLLVGPRIDLTFSRKVFLTTFIQYNNQINNLNINTRLQWRFAPVSDFFLVYTDNYDSLNWGTKNRALVAKLTYWLNL
jgi:Domain of unknown function (DUF5916)